MKYLAFKPTLSLLLICALTVLSGCSSIVANTHKGTLVENEGVRTWGSLIDDGVIESKAKINILNSNPIMRQARVRAISYNGILLLVGQIPNPTLSDVAITAVKGIRHVKSVESQLEVAPNITLTRKAKDSYLAGRIKVAISRNTDITVNRVKAIVDNGNVYLMGLVNKQEAQLAVSAVSQVPGIVKIVKVFEYLD
ncbi:MAG: BON domain-containing protein [Pseudomonadota bacterium]